MKSKKHPIEWSKKKEVLSKKIWTANRKDVVSNEVTEEEDTVKKMHEIIKKTIDNAKSIGLNDKIEGN